MSLQTRKCFTEVLYPKLVSPARKWGSVCYGNKNSNTETKFASAINFACRANVENFSENLVFLTMMFPQFVRVFCPRCWFKNRDIWENHTIPCCSLMLFSAFFRVKDQYMFFVVVLSYSPRHQIIDLYINIDYIFFSQSISEPSAVLNMNWKHFILLK